MQRLSDYSNTFAIHEIHPHCILVTIANNHSVRATITRFKKYRIDSTCLRGWD